MAAYGFVFENFLRVSHHGRVWLKNKSETKMWLGKAYYAELLGFFKHRTEANSFTARDIISLPFSALKSIVVSSKFSEGLKHILLDRGFIFFHIVLKLCEKNDETGLKKNKAI